MITTGRGHWRSRAVERVGRGLLALVPLVVAARPAAASPDTRPSTIDLPYVVAPGIAGCLSEAEFHEAVRRRLSQDAFAPETPVTVATRIERDGRRLRATLTLRDDGTAGTPAGTPVEASQEIVAGPEECATLSAAAALAVSLTIERSRAPAAVTPPTSPSPPEPPPRAAAPPPASEPPRRPAPRPAKPPAATPSERLHAEVRTHALVTGGYGVLPGASIGTSFGASLKLDRWSGQLEAGAWLPATVESASRGEGARAWLVAMAGAACVHGGHVFACGVGTLGDFRASGTGRLLSRSAGSNYLALGARVGTELPIAGPFSILIHAGVLVPLLRPALRIGDDLLWRAPLAGGELGLGVRMSIL